MNKITKTISTILATLIFVVFALGSGSSGDDGNEVSSVDSGNQKDNISIEEQVLLDEDGLIITAKAYTEDLIWGEGIKLLIENNMDKNLGIGCNALIVNDYMITDLFSSTVAAGKKSNETLYLSNSQLEAAGISNVGQIEIYFHIYNSDTYDTVLDADAVTIKTSAYDSMDTTADNVGKELYNKNGIRIVGKYVDETSFWGAAALLYIENNSGKNVTVSCDDVSVNGFMVTSLFASTIYDGKKSVDEITFFETDLEENEIEKIENIELKFHIYDSDTFATIANTDAITINVAQ